MAKECTNPALYGSLPYCKGKPDSKQTIKIPSSTFFEAGFFLSFLFWRIFSIFATVPEHTAPHGICGCNPKICLI